MSQIYKTLSASGPIPPDIATEYVANTGFAVPALNILNILGTTIAAGTTPVTTTGLGSTIAVEVQISQAIAASNLSNVGLAAFNSAQFTVDANGFVSITNDSPFNYVQINHASSPYTASATDEYISADPSAGVISVLLPNAPTLYRRFTIKDRTGNASLHNITVTTVGGAVLIDGATSRTLAGNFGSVNLLFNGIGYEIY